MKEHKYLSGARQGVSDYSTKLYQAKMTLEIFACLGSHSVHLCIVWPKLPLRNFSSSSLRNHISVHISQAHQPLSMPSESCSICWSDKSEKPLQTRCNFTGIFVKDFSILHYKRDVPASIHSKGKIPVITCGNKHTLTFQNHYWAQKGKTRDRNVQRMEKGIKLKEQNCILNC